MRLLVIVQVQRAFIEIVCVTAELLLQSTVKCNFDINVMPETEHQSVRPFA